MFKGEEDEGGLREGSQERPRRGTGDYEVNQVNPRSSGRREERILRHLKVEKGKKGREYGGGGPKIWRKIEGDRVQSLFATMQRLRRSRR